MLLLDLKLNPLTLDLVPFRGRVATRIRIKIRSRIKIKNQLREEQGF